MPQSKPDNVWIFLVSIIIPLGGGLIASSLWQDRDWFENTVVHPVWRPPNWLFPIVWTIVYTLMGISSYYIFKHGQGFDKFILPLGVYAVQLILNWFWTPIFFVWQSILWALVDIVVLWVLIVVMIILFWRVKKKSAYLLIPYVTWVTIAVALNANYYHLNKNL